MFSIHSCPGGQPLAEESVRYTHDADLILHLRENRSQLSHEARATFTVLIGLFMAMAILPAIQGDMLVPIFALGTMALLVGALEWHSRSQPADEWLVQDDASSACLRLFLESHWQRIEIGRCLSLEEKRAVAPLIARQLGEVCA